MPHDLPPSHSPPTHSQPTLTMADLEPGESARIIRVLAAGAVRSRLLAMGVMPGMTVELQRVAPTGDPLWVRLLGTQLALRRREARLVHVTAEQR